MTQPDLTFIDSETLRKLLKKERRKEARGQEAALRAFAIKRELIRRGEWPGVAAAM